MHSISVPAAMELVVGVGIDMNEPLMFWGQPGVGKSAMMHQLAAMRRAPLVDIRLSQYDSVDLRGIPVPSDDTHLTSWCPPETLPFKGNPNFDEEAELILLFLDEINSAAPAVAAVAYQLVNERRVGEHVLMDNVRIVAAGNREGDRGVTNRMPLPLANRFTHAEIVVDTEAATHHFQDIRMPAVGIAFLNFRKPLLSTFDPSKPEKAFATPRTWEKALRYFANDKLPAHVKQAAMAGAIGDGPAAEFWGFVDIWHKIIPLKEILADPVKCRLPEEPAMNYAVAVNISGSMDEKNASKLHTYLCRLDPEFVVMAWQLAVRRDDALFSTKEFLDFSKKYKAVFR